MAYESEADELLYGGAAGGGKTDLLLGLALTQHQRSIIFRREFPQFAGIIDRSREMVGIYGEYSERRSRWTTFDGRIVEFGAVQYENDKKKFQGRPHDLKAFDELEHFTRTQYEFLIGWTRTRDPEQRTRIVASTNPPSSSEGAWIIDRWAPWLDDKHPNPAVPGELRWFVRIDGIEQEVDGPGPIEHDGETLIPMSRTFIPARVTDNPYYMESGYMAMLQALPEPLRSQLWGGSFTVGREDNPWQIIPTDWVRLAQDRWTADRPRLNDGALMPLDELGVDVARGGRDKTVISRRYGPWFAPLLKYPGSETPNGALVAGLVATAMDNPCPVMIDVVGVGGSPYDHLVEDGVAVTGINAAAGTQERDRSGLLGFANMRALMWWRMREALDPEHGQDLALPTDSELLADLVAPRWKRTARGIQVESKEDVIARLGRSPDAADAVILALMPPPIAGVFDNPWHTLSTGGPTRGRRRTLGR